MNTRRLVLRGLLHHRRPHVAALAVAALTAAVVVAALGVGDSVRDGMAAVEAQRLGRVVGVRVAVLNDEEQEPWAMPPSRTPVDRPIGGALPETLFLVLGNQVYVPKKDLPPALRNRLIRIAAFQNPEYSFDSEP